MTVSSSCWEDVIRLWPWPWWHHGLSTAGLVCEETGTMGAISTAPSTGECLLLETSQAADTDRDVTKDKSNLFGLVGENWLWTVMFLQTSIPPELNESYWHSICQMDRVKRIWYLSPMRAAKVQASLRIRAVSPEPSLLAHTSSESRGTFRKKARSLAPLNGWACAV